jgi:hypothetical protein
MKRLIQQLVLGFFAALCVAGCSAEVSETSEDVSAVEQAQSQSCFVTAHSVWETVLPLSPGYLQFNVKAMNIGSASCSYKVSIDVYHNGALSYATPVLGPYTLAPYVAPGPTKTTAQTAPVTSSCSYDVWFKYRNTPSSSETWHRDVNGPFWC